MLPWIRAATLALIAGASPCLAQAPADALSDAAAAHARRDYPRALRLLMPLARAGNPEAQVRLGQMHYHGQGVRENDAEAFAWFQRAALVGHADGQFHLANMYAFGFGVPREEADPDRAAARWYFEAARQEHPEAQYSLGILFYSGKGVEQNNGEALRWFRRAANHGHRDAQRFIDGHADRR